MTYPAARATDLVEHEGAHAGIILLLPCTCEGPVLIEGFAAVHAVSAVECGGTSPSGRAHAPAPSPANYVAMGSASVLIHGHPAARLKPSGDLVMCGGTLAHPASALRSVLIGGPSVVALPFPGTDAETIEQALFLVRTSDFARTPEGRRVVQKLDELAEGGDIRFEALENAAGRWDDGTLLVNASENASAESTASELVHEATHALDDDDYGGDGNSVDEEARCWDNQLDFYDEQRARGYRQSRLDQRQIARDAGRIRDEVSDAYEAVGLTLPEHR